MKTILTFVLICTASIVHGQKDAQAEPFLDKAAKTFDPGHALEIEFDYVREDLQAGGSSEGSGTILLHGEKYRIDLGDAIVWFDGETQYSLNKEIEEVYVSVPDPDNTDFMFTDPIKLLRNYKTDFKYRLMGEGQILGIPATEVQLYPEELGGPYALLKLYFTADKSDLKAIFVRNKEGILYTMLITSLEKKENLEEGIFRFKEEEYPNVDLIDLL